MIGRSDHECSRNCSHESAAKKKRVIINSFSYQLGPLQITGFGIAVLIAFVAAQIICQRELARRGHDYTALPDLMFAALAGTFVGAKLYYVLIITHNPRDFFSRGGFVFWGGFVGAIIAVALVIHRKHLNFNRISDVAGIAIAAGYSIGRTGCWAVGDDYGRPWDSRWAVTFPNGAPPTTVRNLEQIFHVHLPRTLSSSTLVSVYPTELYEVVLGFVMFIILWKLRDHKHAEGWLFGLYLVLAGIERFLIEFMRAKDDRFFIGGISTAQVFAAGITAVGVVWMLMRRKAGTPGHTGIYARAHA